MCLRDEVQNFVGTLNSIVMEGWQRKFRENFGVQFYWFLTKVLTFYHSLQADDPIFYFLAASHQSACKQNCKTSLELLLYYIGVLPILVGFMYLHIFWN